MYFAEKSSIFRHYANNICDMDSNISTEDKFIKLINLAAHNNDEKMKKKPKLLSSNSLSLLVVDFNLIAVLTAQVIPRGAFHSFMHRHIIFINEIIDF